jgi:NADH-quinone oxidoreductase subunit A
MTLFVFCLVVFLTVGVVFLFFHLVLGKLVRPNKPETEKLTIYECGEPTVGSAWIQFDLRFYVVALLFVIFDVEVAFFFPWATVFGKANQLANLPPVAMESADKQTDAQKAIEKQRADLSAQLLPSGVSRQSLHENKMLQKVPKKNSNGDVLKDAKGEIITEDVIAPIGPSEASTWAFIAFWDIIVFFSVLMVGFFYVWRRGDIDWVRAYAPHKEPAMEAEKPVEQQKVLA